jgi:UDP-glucose 4-epimerase
MADDERFLVTGVASAVGAWVVRHLLDSGVDTIALGPAEDDRRLRLATTPSVLASLQRIDAPVTDHEAVRAAMASATHVVHTDDITDDDLEADPDESAARSIGGLATVMDAAAEAGPAGLAFESSMSVFAPSANAILATTGLSPRSLLGCVHLAREVLAGQRFRSAGQPSIGLRTHVVYGPGHDRGSQGGATRLIAAAVEGRAYRIDHRGPADFQFVSDVARALITAARESTGCHRMVNLHGEQASTAMFLQAVAARTGVRGSSFAAGDLAMPVSDPDDKDDGPLGALLATSLDEGIRSTIETLRWTALDLYR